MTLGQIWIYDKFVEQLSELNPKKTLGLGGRGDVILAGTD
jgi:hypothetical protein